MDAVIELFDTLGNLVYSNNIVSGNGIWEIDAKFLESGIYICSLYFDGYKVDTQKITVLR
jgi:hypothetical protein